MPDDFTKDGGIKSDVDVNAAFKEAHDGVVKKKKEPAKAKAALEMKPRGPGGLGQGRGPVVSPQLRDEDRDREQEMKSKKMRVTANFNKAARNPLKRMKRAARERDQERDDIER